MEELKKSTEQFTGGQLTLFQEDHPVNPIQSVDSEKVRKTRGMDGSKLYDLYGRLCHLSPLLKMFTESQRWHSISGVLTWSAWATRSKRLIFRLHASGYQPWNGTCGLLPRPLKSDSKGSGAKRYLNSEANKGNFREVIRDQQTDGQYPNPDFVTWVKGFPEGWGNLTAKL